MITVKIRTCITLGTQALPPLHASCIAFAVTMYYT